MKYEFDIVVLIDCWPSGHPHMQTATQEKYYQRLINKLSTMYFEYVAFATYKGGSDEDNTVTFDTDSYIVEHLKSASHGANVTSKTCYNILDIYKEFPALQHKEDLNILVGGQSWWHCLHWRPLGFCGWIQQGMLIHSHPDLVHFEGNEEVVNTNAFYHDPIVKWEPTDNCDDNTFMSGQMRYNIAQDNPPDMTSYLKYMYK